MILLLYHLLVFVNAQYTDCALTMDCPESYKPVCAVALDSSPPKTYPNYCQACKAPNVIKYANGPCSDTNSPSKPSNYDPEVGTTDDPKFSGSPNGSQSPTSWNSTSNSTSTPVQNQNTNQTPTELIICSDPRPTACPDAGLLTCGIFDKTKAGGNFHFTNECLACSDLRVKSYFFGNCSKFIPEVEHPELFNCSDSSRSNECFTNEFIETCAYLDRSVQCLNQPCLQPFSNPCQACKSPTVKKYFLGKCDNYNKLFKSANAESESIIPNYKYCPVQRPENCEFSSETKQICGIKQNCTGSGCLLTYINSCEACKDLRIEGFYEGVCQSQPVLSLALMILLVLSLY